MCRIFYSPSNDTLFEHLDLLRFFTQLEKSMGRDGNGVYIFNGGILDKSATSMPSTEFEGKFIFHTRLATHGLKTDYNCQPFVGKRYILAHNGVFTSIESCAQLLGFRGSDKKYSDSYMIHYVIEKVGILNFYLSFIDKYYGVLLIHDKQLEKTFLLKSGGQFEVGKLDSGSFIYGSSDIDFWQLKDNPISLSSGLYRLEENGYTQLHKPEITSTYGWKARRNQNLCWTTADTTEKTKTIDSSSIQFCEWCYEEFQEGEEKYEDYGYVLCETCYYVYGDREFPDEYPDKVIYAHPSSESTDINVPIGSASDTEIRGINDLFGEREPYKPVCHECEIPLGSIKCWTADHRNLCINCYREDLALRTREKKFKEKVPKRCHGCNWLKGIDCYFGGTENKDFESGGTVESGLSICNTKANQIHVGIDCVNCKNEIRKDDEWKLYDNYLVLCMDCYNTVMETLENEAPTITFMPDKCGNCGLHFEEGDLIIEDKKKSMYICDMCEKYSFEEKSDYKPFAKYKRQKTDDEYY